MNWPLPKSDNDASNAHKRLAELYRNLRQASTEYSEFLGDAAEQKLLTDQELKHLDLAHVCVRLGYKRIKKILTNAGFECGRRKLGRT